MSYRLQEADVLSKSSNAATEGDEEHDHAHHDQDDRRVDQERVSDRVCKRQTQMSLWATSYGTVTSAAAALR